MRVLGLRGDLNLLQESLRAECFREFRFEDLEGNLTMMLEVICEVDGCHAALAERPVEPVAIGEGRDKQFELCGWFAPGKRWARARPNVWVSG